jgi:ComF family protein
MDLPYTEDSRHKNVELLNWFNYFTPVSSVRSLLYYRKGGITQKLIHQLKYEGQKELGIELGRWFGKTLMESSQVDFDCILPIPLHKKRQRQRGYNQSELIASGVSEICRVPVLTGNLIRTTHSSTQTKKKRISRHDSLEGVFRLRKPDEMKEKRILLLDDVITTGATLLAAAQIMAHAIPSQLHLGTIARA